MITLEQSDRSNTPTLDRPLQCKTEQEVKDLYHKYEAHVDQILEVHFKTESMRDRMGRCRLYQNLEELKSECDRQIMMLRLRGDA